MSAPTCEAVAPNATGKPCAWCFPGIESAQGHTICADHKQSELIELHLAITRGDLAFPFSPKK